MKTILVIEDNKDIRENTGFEYDLSPELGETASPTEEEKILLKTRVAEQIGADYPDFAKRVWGS